MPKVDCLVPASSTFGVFSNFLCDRSPAKSEELQTFKDLYLGVKARVWPCLSYMRPVRSTWGGTRLTDGFADPSSCVVHINRSVYLFVWYFVIIAGYQDQ